MVKPDLDVVLMMPVEPPAAGPDRAPPPDPVRVGEDVAVAEGDDVDGEKVAAAATPEPVSPTTAHVSPAPMIHPPFFFGRNRHALTRRACAAVDSGADSASEWLVGSQSFMVELLSLWQQPRACRPFIGKRLFDPEELLYTAPADAIRAPHGPRSPERTDTRTPVPVQSTRYARPQPITERGTAVLIG
jgi:hypothetical protein